MTDQTPEARRPEPAAEPLALRLNDQLGLLPEPAGFRTRYRSEPGMIGHYPWTYADAGRRRGNRPECEYEDLFTAEQMRTAVDAARMAGVHSVQEQTAVIVRAALELLEAVEGCEAFPPEKMAAFRRVFGA